MRRIAITVLPALLFVTGCLSGTDADPGCVEGEVSACTCSDGSQGLRDCGGDGQWGACVCDTDGGSGGDSDGGAVDAGPTDAGPTDAGPIDGGPLDAGPTDAGPVDAGPLDAGPMDAGPADAGPVDAGPDAGPLACAADADCTAPAACVAGACVAPVDPASYVAEAAGRPASYGWQLTLGNPDAPQGDCCFDLDGDGQIDDQFGRSVSSLTNIANLDAQTELDQAVDDGALVRIVDWVELPPALADGPVRFSWFSGDLVPDASGNLPAPADRALGGVHVRLDPASFGSYGAEHQFNQAQLSAGHLEAWEGSFGLSVPILGATAQLRVSHARMEADLAGDAAGCSGVCTDGPARLGGGILAPDLADFADGLLRACTCAGVDPSQPVLVATFDAAAGWSYRCTDNHGAASGCDLPYCNEIGLFCNAFPSFLGTLDLDTDGDGLNDAQSMGVEVDLSGAVIDGLTP